MSLITVTTENPTFPKENLIDKDYSKPFKFTVTTGGTIEIDFLVATTFDAVFIGNHNFDPSAVVTIKVGSSSPPATVVDTPAYRVKNMISQLTSQNFRFLSVGIVDSNSTATHIGQLVVGVKTLLPRGIRFGSTLGVQQELILERTNRGKRFALELFQLEKRSYQFRFPESERAQFLAFWQGVNGSLDPFVWCESDALVDPAESLYVSIEEPGFFPKEISDPAPDPVFDYSLTLVEESIGAEIEA